MHRSGETQLTTQISEVLQVVSLHAHVRITVSMLRVILGDRRGIKALEFLPSALTLELETEGSSKIFGKGGESLTELLSSDWEHTSSLKHSRKRVESRL